MRRRYTHVYQRADITPDEMMNMSAMDAFAYVAESEEEAKSLAALHPKNDILLREWRDD